MSMSQGWGEEQNCYSRSGEDIVKPLQVWPWSIWLISKHSKLLLLLFQAARMNSEKGFSFKWANSNGQKEKKCHLMRSICDGVEENIDDAGDENELNWTEIFECLQVWKGWSEVSAQFSDITAIFLKYSVKHFSNITYHHINFVIIIISLSAWHCHCLHFH